MRYIDSVCFTLEKLGRPSTKKSGEHSDAVIKALRLISGRNMIPQKVIRVHFNLCIYTPINALVTALGKRRTN